jgi:DNA-binding NtrC family response regulator
MPSPGTKAPNPRVLIVDDERSQADTLAKMLQMDGFETTSVYSGKAALSVLQDGSISAVISDLSMPGMSGLELFNDCARLYPRLIFIIVTGFGTMNDAVEAMRAGVHDFVTKPVGVSELVVKLKKALRLQNIETELTELKGTVESLRSRVKIVGDSEGMRNVLDRVHQVAKSTSTVLISGESGTGKELVARAIHLQSDRHSRPYVKVNCAAIPDSLLESELFGHKKGSFTGATQDRPGRFQSAQGGTLLLDEVGDLPIALQPKLLRVIQERELEPIGTSESVPIDVRLIAATHQDLRTRVQEGKFREDLFYRLNVIPLHLPPLRLRTGDIVPLSEHFLRKYCDENHRAMRGFQRDAESMLKSYSWPGNVRELENCIERAVVLSRNDWISAADLLLGPRSEEKDGGLQAAVNAYFDAGQGLDTLERGIILEALKRCGGNLSRAARSLGLSRRTLQYRVEKIRDEESLPKDDDSDSAIS